MKKHLTKLVIGLALILTLLGGIVALGHASSAATVTPAHHSLTDVIDPPPGH